MIGQTLSGKYALRREIARGSMGTLYEAVHTGMGRPVAVKVLGSAELLRDPVLIARFHREARATGAISSKHVIQVLDSGTDPDSRALYLVTELLRGEGLDVLLQRRGALPVDLALRITAQACIGLENVHAARLVHRALSPANIFLSLRDADEIVVKLRDFAVTKTLQDQASEDTGGLTAAGTLLGAPAYMAPEVVQASPAIDARADLWSLGAVLFELVTGRPPFSATGSLAQQLVAVVSGPIPSLAAALPSAPPAVAAIVERALQRDVGARFQSATEMRSAIEACLGGGYSIHRADLDAPAPRAIAQPGAPAATGRRLDWPVIALVVLLAAAGVIGYLLAKL